MKRFDPSVGSSLITLGVIVMVGLLLSLVALAPQDGTTVGAGPAAADGGGGGEGGAGLGGDGVDAEVGVEGQPGAEGGGSGSGPVDGSESGDRKVKTSPGVQCAPGKNGGSTDVGVSGNSVKLAATIVTDGPGASFLGSVRVGMQAVLNKTNAAGGICGRRLNLTLRNDSWESERGRQYIENFVEGEKVFALAVVPSSEGLKAADSFIRSRKVPVVGSDGMLIDQYKNPWIWPVATSTISTMRVMAKNAHDRGARNFAIVFDAKYHFGPEGAAAFNQAFKELTGNDIPGFDPSLKNCVKRFCGIQPQQPSYATQVRSFNSNCGANSDTPGCDFIAYLLEPDTALSWFKENPYSIAQYGVGGAQPLFTRKFAENCQVRCDGMWIWTGYNPPIEDLASLPGVAKYVNDIRSESVSADVANQFLEGGYLGMTLLVEGLKKVGPTLTRDNLRVALDSMTLDTGLSSPLTWRANDHFANVTAQAFEIQYKQSFSGWRRKTGFLADPWIKS